MYLPNTAFPFPCSDYPFHFLFLILFSPSLDFFYPLYRPPPHPHFVCFFFYSFALAFLFHNTHKYRIGNMRIEEPLFKEERWTLSMSISWYIKTDAWKMSIYVGMHAWFQEPSQELRVLGCVAFRLNVIKFFLSPRAHHCLLLILPYIFWNVDGSFHHFHHNTELSTFFWD